MWRGAFFRLSNGAKCSPRGPMQARRKLGSMWLATGVTLTAVTTTVCACQGKGSVFLQSSPMLVSGGLAVVEGSQSKGVPPVTAAEEAVAPPPSLAQRLWRGQRVVRRVLHIIFLAIPVVVTYPLSRLSDEWSDWWLRVCLSSTESGGAMIIKLCQWASSRPDIFGDKFCTVFKALQDNTTPHPWKQTRIAMCDCLGDEWESQVRLQAAPIGSGCIAQVYKGEVRRRGGDGEGTQEVAVKVMHPGIRDTIDADLDLLRIVASLAASMPFGYGETVKWMNVEGMVEEFGEMLRGQLDLRVEEDNLRRFNVNFADDDDVRFPECVEGFPATADVLFEEFVHGIPVEQWRAQNTDNVKEKNRLCDVGIRTICKMIFYDNFLHGDLHPGNIFVSEDNKFVLLDVGIATEYSPRDHELLIAILTNFIKCNGEAAAELMIRDSELRQVHRTRNVQQFVDKINAMVHKAKTDHSFFDQIGNYIAIICNAASDSHVKMNQGFISVALATKVVEGVALSLNPAAEIWRIANPIILKSNLRRKFSFGSYEPGKKVSMTYSC